MKKLIMAAVSFSATTVLLSGAAMAATSISTTGPWSHNKVTVKNTQKCTSKNNNNVSASNLVVQKSKTGSAKVKGNTTGGDATTGDASTSSANSVDATLQNNSACADMAVLPAATGGTIDTTGPGSWNTVTTTNSNTLKVVNNNNLWLSNVVMQGSSSGNAEVSGNTTGGSATSGNASSTSTNTTTINITNN